MDGPRGASRVKMNPDKTTGILDHDFMTQAKDIGKFLAELLQEIWVHIL